MRKAILSLFVLFFTIPAFGQWVDRRFSQKEEPFDSLPKFKSTKYADIEEYIVKEAKLPPQYDAVGRAVVSFVVKTDGSLENIKPIFFDHPAMAEVAVKIIQATDKCWEPAKKKRGRSVDATLEAVIPFGDTIPPSFMGRKPEAFTIYVLKTIRYPMSVLRLDLGKFKVIAKGVVGKDGYMENIRVERSPHEDITKEVTQVLKNSPRWYPAMINGEPERVEIITPINFSLVESKQ